jgi:anti-anti-sigma regulatory factor
MESQSTLVITVPRHFGANDGRLLERELKKRSIDGETVLVFDFARLQQIDNAGLSGLLNCLNWVARQDGKVQLGTMSPVAATLLELTGMDRVFASSTVAEARYGAKPPVPESETVFDEEPIASEPAQARTVAA